jgi:hypothetical protein
MSVGYAESREPSIVGPDGYQGLDFRVARVWFRNPPAISCIALIASIPYLIRLDV